LLRRHLILISLSTFAATVVGCSLLVRLGLSPLRRLSEAVGRVSPSDFQLPINDATLPVELTPITGRLRVTLNELRKAFEREKHAAADISHELRTPVAALMTTLSVALKKTRSVDEYRQTLQDCQGIGRHLRQLVERVMALARLDSGVDRLRQRTVDLQDLAEQCAALVRPLAAERGIEVRVHCPKPVTWTVDADKLREVIINLMHNAVEYNRPRGAVDLTVQADGDTLDVQVHDTGVGIAPEAVEHVFERFYRADPSRQNSDLHAGLGLSIVKGYVELLGGSVTVSSVGGEGSTFRVRLPQTAPA
jgi:signal transduction histidine kinase